MMAKKRPIPEPKTVVFARRLTVESTELVRQYEEVLRLRKAVRQAESRTKRGESRFRSALNYKGLKRPQIQFENRQVVCLTRVLRPASAAVCPFLPMFRRVGWGCDILEKQPDKTGAFFDRRFDRLEFRR